MTNLAMWSLVVGFFLPIVVSVLKQTKWSTSVQSFFAFIVALVAGAGTVYFEKPEWNWRDWVSSSLIVLVTAISTYHGFWKATGVEPSIASATDVTRPE